MIRFSSITRLSAALAWVALAGGAALAAEWQVVPDGDRTRVRFLSEATVESFEGSTGKVEGWISTGDADSISWRIAVDLASIDTGIGLRNTHMRENHLHTDEFPEAVFSGSMAWPEGVAMPGAGIAVDLDLEGRLDLHGVSHPRKIPVRMTLAADGSLEARAAFGVSLADHDIPRPKFLLLKLADVQQVEVRILARPNGERP